MSDTFGSFRLLARLGRGGMAETFVAERTKPGGLVERVCLKRILSDHATDPEFVRLFQNEARLALLLRHPNVVPVLDFGEEHGTWWMSLALVEGLDLRSLLKGLGERGERLSRDVVIYIIAKTAEALRLAHERKLPDGSPAHIVHRDVSPSNVLIDYEGAVMLADFGIAKAVVAEGRTQTGIMRGKPSYMPPEQALAQPVDARADLFALGVMLFELLAGARPFDGAGEVATIQNVLGGHRQSLRVYAPDVPDALVALVDSLIEPELELRMRSAQEVLDALDPLHPPPSVARTLGALVRSVKPLEPILAGGLTVRDVAGAKAKTSAGAPAAVAAASAQADAGATEDATQTTAPEAPDARANTSTVAARGTRRATLATIAGVVIVAGLAAAFASGAMPRETEDARPALGPTTPPATTPPAAPVTAQESASAAQEPLPVADEPRADARPEPASEGATEAPRAHARDSTRMRAALIVAPARDEAPTPAEEPATLQVIVPPVGDVWIDGREVGQAPITEQLGPGRHVIEGVRGLERAQEVVILAPGEHRQLVLRPHAP
jgi:eukaryotic-like serine/threonine-protein kinase